VIYTNAIEALNRPLRKAIKTKEHFPNEDAARKLIYLAITNATLAWTKNPQLDSRAPNIGTLTSDDGDAQHVREGPNADRDSARSSRSRPHSEFWRVSGRR